MIWLTLPAPDLMAHEGACRSAHLGCEGALRQLLEKAAVAAYLLDRLCLTHNGPRGSLRLQSELQACFWFTEGQWPKIQPRLPTNRPSIDAYVESHCRNESGPLNVRKNAGHLVPIGSQFEVEGLALDRYVWR